MLEAGDGSVGTANYMIISLTKSNKYQNSSLPFIHDVKIRCFGTKKKTGKTCRHGNSIMNTEIYNSNLVGTVAARPKK